jgi:hypothetical protein
LAPAFVAGRGSELFFVALDKIVRAFSGGRGASNVIVRETRSGGGVTTAIEGKVTTVSNSRSAPQESTQQPNGMQKSFGSNRRTAAARANPPRMSSINRVPAGGPDYCSPERLFRGQTKRDP